MSETVNFKEIHAYMLQKTAEYYRCPPAELVEAVMEEEARAGAPVTREEARKRVTPIQIQRYLKAEMQKKCPEFISAIPSNPLKEE